MLAKGPKPTFVCARTEQLYVVYGSVEKLYEVLVILSTKRAVLFSTGNNLT